MTAINHFDGSILLWIQAHLRGAMNAPMIFITHLGDHGFFWIALALILTAIPRTRKLGLTCAIAMATAYLIANLGIKNAVARIRPYEFFEGLERIVAAERSFSFPSGHATNAFSCGWVLFRRAPKKYGVPALILAILIALSRLYVGVHYPTDVLGGALIGIGSATFALWLSGKIKYLRD